MKDWMSVKFRMIMSCMSYVNGKLVFSFVLDRNN